MNGQLLVHIGYSKAGSSWLQEYFRSQNSGFNHIFSHTNLLYENIVSPHPLSFELSQAQKILLSHLESVDTNQVPVVSSERLCGHWASGGYDTKEIALRLKEIYPDANILIVIREQKSMISSIYRQYVRKGGSRKLNDFLFPPGSGKGRYPMFNFDFLEYHKIISCYQNLFDKKKILVLPIELLKNQPLVFCNRIRTFSGLNELNELSFSVKARNEGISAFMANYKRFLNPLLCRDALNDYSIYYSGYFGLLMVPVLNFVEKMAPYSIRNKVEQKLSDGIKSIIKDRYKISNRESEILADLNLSQYSYDLPQISHLISRKNV